MASKRATFRCGLAGLVSKEAPDLLKDGQYRSAFNIVSNQEGSISSRVGVKQVGQIASGLNTAYVVRKLVVSSESDPLTPSTNPRYLGVLTLGGARNIYRTTNYSSTTLVASAVDNANQPHWEMAPYSSGESGAPWAYFACPNAMLKDSGLSPLTPLAKWGIPAPHGVVLAAVVTGSINVSTVSATLPTWSFGVVITLATAAAISDFDSITFSALPGVTFVTTDGRTNPVTQGPWAIRVGVPDSTGKNIINTTTQFRVFDNNGQAVTMTGSYTGSGAVSGIASPGNLDGGAQSSPNNTQPYDWVTTYKETATGDQGNPSQIMNTASTASVTSGGLTYTTVPVSIHGGQVSLAIWGTGVAGIGYIKVFRRGGTLTDEVGRLVATIPNPGNETFTVITDNTADADLVFAEQWETDNTPPVVSTVISPIIGTTGSISTGYQTVTVSGASSFSNMPVGQLIHINDPAGISEDVYAESFPSSTSFRAFFQFAHGSSGVTIEIDAIYGQPCNLVAIIGDAVLVAGDPNNPNVLYKNKNGAPQSFPIGTDAAGAITSVNVGTPSNGIVQLTECRGQALCLNVSAVYEVPLLGGASLFTPTKVSGKGLKAQSAWCKTSSEEVWWLSDDGVYSWDGAASRKRTEVIDPIFHNQQFNGIPPLSMSPSALQNARMEYRRGIIRLVYEDVNAHFIELFCEPMYGDRWYQCNEGINTSEFITALYCEPDTQSLIVSATSVLGAFFGIADATQLVGSVNTTSDWWLAGSPSGGTSISWAITLPWLDMGDPIGKKLFEEIWLDIDPQITINSTLQVELLLDYSETVVDQFQVVAAPGTSTLGGRQPISLLPNLQNTSGSIYQSYAREARAISFLISGFALPVQQTLYSLIIQYEDAGIITSGSSHDWMDLGSKHDKRIYQMSVIFDTAGTNRNLVLEMRGGRDGLTAGISQVFSLVSPTDLGSGRCLKVFPVEGTVAGPIIAKLLRVRPYASTTISGGLPQSSIDLFRIFEVAFPDAEQYPPDIVSRAGTVQNGKVVEAWTNGGYDYDKYANQICWEVNTNGVAVNVQLQCDGANIGAVIVITSTETDRKRNITLPPGLKGKSWSAFVDPAQAALTTGAGMWQVFNQSWKFQPADRGEVGHTFDWDDLGWPYDKYLRTVTVEWDDTTGAPVTLQLDTLSGIGGQTINSNILSGNPIVVSGGRGKQTFALPIDTIAKMIRLYPQGTTVPTTYKQWKYFWDKTDYPADIVTSTPWRDTQTPNDKNPSWFGIDADTAGVPASVNLQNETGAIVAVNHTGTLTSRKANYPIPADVIGKMWRLSATAGGFGKFQLFNWELLRWHPFGQDGAEDPPDVVLWTPWNDFGYPYPKIARTFTATIDTGGQPCQIVLASQEGASQTFPVSTTYETRRISLSCNANLTGTQWRLLLTPGTGGKAKLWDWGLDAVKLPPAQTQWSSNPQGFGYKGWKFCFQFWLDYIGPGGVNVILTSDTGTFTIPFPNHTTRGVERALLPDIWGAGYNKSKLYTISIVAGNVAQPFQMFADCSGIEWIPCGGDRHASFQQTSLSEFMQVAI